MGPYKVYIIDEVHMLSKSAFNALLTTLEEPPSHVKFILATTELHKVPDTILSRCQQLFLKPLPFSILTAYLADICQKEGVAFEAEALEILAEHAEGGARNALFLLEQAILLMEPPVMTALCVRKMLGVVHEKELESLLASIEAQNLEKTLETARALLASGLLPQALLKGLMQHVHKKTLAHFLSKDPGSSASVRLWHLMHKGFQDVEQSAFPLVVLEMLLVRLIYLSPFPTPQELLKGFESGTTPPPQPVMAPVLREQDVDMGFGFQPVKKPAAPPPQRDFKAFLTFLKTNREAILAAYLTQSVSFVSWVPGALTLHWNESKPQPPSFKTDVEKYIALFMGQKDQVVFSDILGQASLADQQKTKQATLLHTAQNHPLVQQTQSLFAGSVIETVEEIDPH
jgi:DNA polymerase-3 subunit gamma/tau